VAPLRIGVDACCWSNRRGFGRYTRELLTHMVAGSRGHAITLFVDAQTAATHALPAGCRVEVVGTSEQPTQAASAEGSRRVGDLWRLSRRASAARSDVLFFPAVYSYYPLLGRRPTVVAFHDAIAEEHPALVMPAARGRMLWRAKTWLARRQATCLLTVSESARDQIVSAFGYPRARIHVVAEAAGAEFRPLRDDERPSVDAVRRTYGLPADAPLVVYVGGLSPHKNLEGLLQAMARLRGRGANAHLAIVGDPAADGFLSAHASLSALRASLGLTDAVTFTGYVPGDHLVALYNAASVAVLPSFSEGFGLPALEAMACGAPVAASRRGSIPEVVGEAGVLFDPADPEDMARALASVLADEALRRRLRAAGLERAALFSWETAAARTLDVLEEAARGPAA
jgi:glycosyltransferase involved in cell wall biosynthesis